MTRIVVTGPRDFTDRALVFSTLDRVLAKHPGLEIAQGACPTGVDLYAREWADQWIVPCKDYPANWSLGPKAGPLRNAEMLTDFRPDGVVAFPVPWPRGRGTADCIARVGMLGVRVWGVES